MFFFLFHSLRQLIIRILVPLYNTARIQNTTYFMAYFYLNRRIVKERNRWSWVLGLGFESYGLGLEILFLITSHSYLRTVYSDELNSVVVTTPPTSDDSVVLQPLVISLMFNDGSRLVTNHKFIYRLDPRITSIEPRNHLIVWVQVHCV